MVSVKYQINICQYIQGHKTKRTDPRNSAQIYITLTTRLRCHKGSNTKQIKDTKHQTKQINKAEQLDPEILS